MNDRLIHGRYSLFGLLAGIGYVLAYTQEYTPFYFYPLSSEFFWMPYQAELGPGITYYAWKCIGLLGGGFAWLVPRPWVERVPSRALPLGAVALSVTVVIHELHWFYQ